MELTCLVEGDRIKRKHINEADKFQIAIRALKETKQCDRDSECVCVEPNGVVRLGLSEEVTSVLRPEDRKEEVQRLLRTNSGCLGSRQKGQCGWNTGS